MTGEVGTVLGAARVAAMERQAAALGMTWEAWLRTVIDQALPAPPAEDPKVVKARIRAAQLAGRKGRRRR